MSLFDIYKAKKLNAKAYEHFNIWDENWESGGLLWATGAEYANTNARRTGFIPVTPSETYYLKSPYDAGIVWYDENKTVKRSETEGMGNTSFKAPSTAHFLRIVFISGISSSTVYNHNICVNVSKTSGVPKNGDYVPYHE